MKNVHVLLRDDVTDLGRVGDVVRVAPGYARNFLYPRRLAIAATDDNQKAMKRRRERADAEIRAREAEFRAVIESLSAVTLKTVMKADENGRLFGSVNAAGVARLLEAAGHPVEESRVRLGATIKKVGEHTVRVHVHGDLSAELTLVVEAEEAPAEA
jgi:large subunit ribosomal protein L9